MGVGAKKILYVASEATPFAATGGLGDVMGSLPPAVKSALGEGADVRAVIPLYPQVREKFGDRLNREWEGEVALAWRRQYLGIYSLLYGGVRYYFIDNEYYFRRPFLYGNYDDGERFAYFGKAVLALMTALDFIPDILHANDWQSAPALIYLARKTDIDPRMRRIKTLYTVHNLEYQGVFDPSIAGDVFELAPWDIPFVEYDGRLNLMKGAVVLADRVNTVSPRYAEEIRTDYYGAGLAPVLRMVGGKLTGILNGIDTAYYNSETDKEIKKTFSAQDLSGKAADKRELQRVCGLPKRADIPLVAMVSRLAAHKGFDLVQQVFSEVLEEEAVQVVLLGTGDGDLEAYFSELMGRYPRKFAAKFGYDPALARVFYAGADLFLMPSKSEPCGLSQMIASRYGAVPLVRETGGLYDTIKPYNPYTGEGNGFTFQNYNAHDMKQVLKEALALYRNRERWTALVRRVMEADFRWERSARKYIELYESMTGKK